MSAGLKTPERGCVVLDQPQHVTNSIGFRPVVAGCGWFRCCGTQPRSVFRPALIVSRTLPAAPDAGAFQK